MHVYIAVLIYSTFLHEKIGLPVNWPIWVEKRWSRIYWMQLCISQRHLTLTFTWNVTSKKQKYASYASSSSDNLLHLWQTIINAIANQHHYQLPPLRLLMLCPSTPYKCIYLLIYWLTAVRDCQIGAGNSSVYPETNALTLDLCRFPASAAAILRCTVLGFSSVQLTASLSSTSGPDAVDASPPATGSELIIHLPVAKEHAHGTDHHVSDITRHKVDRLAIDGCTVTSGTVRKKPGEVPTYAYAQIWQPTHQGPVCLCDQLLQAC